MINWNQELVNEPLYITSLSDEELIAIIHHQAVERAVKTVTEASEAVSGFKERDGFIHQKIMSRKEISKFETKSDYNPKN